MFENDLVINGKHATYTKFLVTEEEIFKRYIDVYMNAAIMGFLYGRMSEKDSESNDKARIFADVLAKERNRCDFIYRLIMLLDETTKLTIEERIDRAFRDDAKGDKSDTHIANMRLFNKYVLGGIEVLYEKFTEDCTTKEDYIDKIYEVTKGFYEETEGVEYSDKIKEAIEGY